MKKPQIKRKILSDKKMVELFFVGFTIIFNPKQYDILAPFPCIAVDKGGKTYVFRCSKIQMN